MVAEDRWDTAIPEQCHHRFRVRAVADIVSQREDIVDVCAVDVCQNCLKRLQITVNVGENRYSHKTPLGDI